MSLHYLQKTGYVQEHRTNAVQLLGLLDAAIGSIADAMQETVGAATRFDEAYRAVALLCRVALWANGYRPSATIEEQQRVLIGSLRHSIGLDSERISRLDALRIAVEYSVGRNDARRVRECIDAAGDLLRDVTRWIARYRPDLAAVDSVNGRPGPDLPFPGPRGRRTPAASSPASSPRSRRRPGSRNASSARG